MKLLDFFDSIYRPQRLVGRSQNTTRLYHCGIKRFGESLGRPATIADLTDEKITAHMQKRLDDGLSVATANKERNQMLAMWRYANRKGLIETWPNVVLLNEPQRTPVAWTSEEIHRLFNAIEKIREPIGPIPGNLWWESIVRIGLDTGERIGALRESRWEWLAGDWINFPAEYRKGKTRDRNYRLSAKTIETLRKLRDYCRGPQMFPWPFSQTYIWKRWREIVGLAGFDASRYTGFHKFRRTCASVIYAAGLDPQEAMDHSDRRTTQRYIDVRFSRDRQTCDILADFLANPEKKGRDTA